jgi:hypothetical protein
MSSRRSGERSGGRSDRRRWVVHTLLLVPILGLMRMCMHRMAVVMRIELTLELEALEAALARERLREAPPLRQHVDVDIAESVLEFVLEFVSVSNPLQGTTVEDRSGNSGGSCRRSTTRARAGHGRVVRPADLWV